MLKDKIKLDNSSKIILRVFIIYLIIMLIVFLPGYIKRRQTLYIITNSIRIKYKNGKWSKITDINDYRLKEFNIYEDGSFKGKYKILLANRISLYENGKKVDYNGEIFAYRGSIKLNLYDNYINDISKLDEVDKYNVESALLEIGLSPTDNFNLIQKIELDVDNNGSLENIYCLNNFYVEDNNNERFSLIFMYKNNKVYIIEKEVTTNALIDDSKIFSIMNIIDIKDDGKFELLYTSNYPNGPLEDACTKLYDLNKNKSIHNFCE